MTATVEPQAQSWGDRRAAPPDAGVTRRWLCRHCGRFLATVIGRVFETPAGVRGNLPAVIRCPRCGTRNVRVE